MRGVTLADGCAIALLLGLLLLEGVTLGMGWTAKDFVVAKAEFTYDRDINEAWMLKTARFRAEAVLNEVMPTFRRHRPEIDSRHNYLAVTILVASVRQLEPAMAHFENELNAAVRLKEGIPATVQPIKLVALKTAPYQWFKTLDFVAAFILASSIFFFIFFRPLDVNRSH